MKKIAYLLVLIPVMSCAQKEVDCSIASLNHHLISMEHLDQEIRMELMPLLAKNQEDGSGGLKLFSLVTKMQKQDEENQRNLIAILEKCGWPKELSREAHTAIFLILQHSPDATIQQYYPTVKEMTRLGYLDPDDEATMFDRLQMFAGKPQRYGTQTFENHKKENAVWPVQHIDSLPYLRKSVGLPTMETYFEIVRDSTGIKMVWDKSLTIEEANRSRQ